MMKGVAHASFLAKLSLRLPLDAMETQTVAAETTVWTFTLWFWYMIKIVIKLQIFRPRISERISLICFFKKYGETSHAKGKNLPL